jgi:hypothetical protein
MYIRHFENSHVVADVYPYAESDSDPRFLAASPHFAVLPEGEILFNGKTVTVEGVVDESVRRILSVIEAEKIAGKVVDRSIIATLATLLEREIL